MEYHVRGAVPGLGGPEGFSHIVVLFNGERGWWVTGFQPEAGLGYVVRQGGLWIWRPR